MLARPYLSWMAIACVFIATSTAPLAIPSNPSAIANNGGRGARTGSGVASSIARIAAVVVFRLPKRAVSTPFNGKSHQRADGHAEQRQAEQTIGKTERMFGIGDMRNPAAECRAVG